MQAQFKLIFVEPKYQINVGYAARVAKNFGIDSICFVNPRAKIDGETAIRYAKHARSIVDKPKIAKSFDSAISDCRIIVGTTGNWKKGRMEFRNVMLAEDAVRKALSSAKGKKIGIVIGRDDIGLTKEELEKCDIVAYIPTDAAYPILNTTHALAIILYLFTNSSYKMQYGSMLSSRASDDDMRALFMFFNKLLDGKHVRKRKRVSLTFERMVRQYNPTRSEVRALITAIKQ